MKVLNLVNTRIHLRRSDWNKGFASEIISELLDYGFNTLKLSEIHGICNSGPIVSEKMLIKTGFFLQETILLNGEEAGIYKITPSV
jgi:[ribosomal protein S5]-alanine N-acetyltransferase